VLKKLMVAFALLVLGACRPLPPRTLPDMRTAAERAEDRSVAILRDETHARCGGTWISPTTILTAFHCVSDAGKPKGVDELQAMLAELGVVADIPEWDPTGQTVFYSDRAGTAAQPYTSYDAIVMKFDRKNDLALLSTGLEHRPMHHDTADLSTRNIHDGDEVDVVGSTVGLPFTYLHGWVAATRPADDEKPFKTLELAVAGVNHGNSGGGAFDDHGDIIGLADFMLASRSGFGGEVQGIAFFVHRDVIAAFLASPENRAATFESSCNHGSS
jgi:S1-C subfamily serine protease